MARWGRRAAGVLPVARDSGRVLLLLRSEWVTEPLTWGLPGGALERREAPMHGAMREFVEETQYSGPVHLFRLGVYREPNFEYHSYIGWVPSEFNVILDWESADAGWFELDELPEPLHPGAAEMFEEHWDRIAAAVEAA